MKFPPFEYARPRSLADVIGILSVDEDAKVLAGGQSLLPLMALRLARPSVLVDLAGLGLDEVAIVDHGPYTAGRALKIGAMARQRQLGSALVADAVPLLADAVRHVGHAATRNRGTVGGSLTHADPAAELPAVAVALGAVAVATGPRGDRSLPCAELADGYFTTTLAADEVLTEIHFPVADAGAAFCEWAPRAGDFAEVGIGVAVKLDAGGTCTGVWAGACGVGAAPIDIGPALAAAGLLGTGSTPDPLLRAAAAAAARATTGAGPDKSSLAGLLAARAVGRAFRHAAARVGTPS